MTISGECFCGAVRYRVEGPLQDPLSCHCSRCRKAFSSQASAYARVNAADFCWTEGEELLTSYVGKHGFGVSFCRVCGSTLTGIMNGTVHGVTLGCLNESPNVADIQHIYVASKASWEVLPEGVVQFSEGRSDGDRI